MRRCRANLPSRCRRQIDRVAHRAFEGWQAVNRECRAATTGNTYCGNLLWQSGLTLSAHRVLPSTPKPKPNYFTPAVGLEAATRAAIKALEHCEKCPGGEKACLKCCDSAALAAHLAQTAAAVLATAQCVKYGPWGMLACAAMVDMTLYEQGNEINDKLHKCGMKCIFGK